MCKIWSLCTTSCWIRFIAVDTASNCAAVAPTKVGNWYQINTFNGRGYGYETHRQMLMDNSLKLSSSYNSADMVDPKTNLMDQKKVEAFVKVNYQGLKKDLPLVDCQNLGITKGRFV